MNVSKNIVSKIDQSVICLDDTVQEEITGAENTLNQTIELSSDGGSTVVLTPNQTIDLNSDEDLSILNVCQEPGHDDMEEEDVEEPVSPPGPQHEVPALTGPHLPPFNPMDFSGPTLILTGGMRLTPGHCWSPSHLWSAPGHHHYQIQQFCFCTLSPYFFSTPESLAAIERTIAAGDFVILM